MKIIEMKDVEMEYSSGIKGLNGVTLSIERGEFVFIVGQSGSGKSTLIKLLLKELEADKGDIVVGGKSIIKLPRRKIPQLRRNIGVVFQDFRLLSDKTIYENVAFAMRVVEAKNKDIKKQVPTVLALVGLAGREDMYPHELSGGEQQRVAIARALVNKPVVLIADEPTGNLDPENSNEIMKLLSEINIRGTTVLVSTHDKDMVNKMQKRVITLEKGKIKHDHMKGGYALEA